jgi:hypothetical protein
LPNTSVVDGLMASWVELAFILARFNAVQAAPLTPANARVRSVTVRPFLATGAEIVSADEGVLVYRVVGRVGVDRV